MTVAPPPVEAVPLVDLLEEVARRLGYDEGAVTLSFEFQSGHFHRFKSQRLAGRQWLESQLGESQVGEQGS